MKAVFGADEIPKEGITAGDLKMAEAAGYPTEERPAPEAPSEPQAPENPLEVVLKDMNKRINQQGELLVQIADRMFAPQNATQQAGSPPVTVMGIPIGDPAQLLQQVLAALRGNDNQAGGFMFDLYKKAHENYDSKVLLPTFSKLAGIDARTAAHVTG